VQFVLGRSTVDPPTGGGPVDHPARATTPSVSVAPTRPPREAAGAVRRLGTEHNANLQELDAEARERAALLPSPHVIALQRTRGIGGAAAAGLHGVYMHVALRRARSHSSLLSDGRACANLGANPIAISESDIGLPTKPCPCQARYLAETETGQAGLSARVLAGTAGWLGRTLRAVHDPRTGIRRNVCRLLA
jgi:hypothetical protein